MSAKHVRELFIFWIAIRRNSIQCMLFHVIWCRPRAGFWFESAFFWSYASIFYNEKNLCSSYLSTRFITLIPITDMIWILNLTFAWADINIISIMRARNCVTYDQRQFNFKQLTTRACVVITDLSCSKKQYKLKSKPASGRHAWPGSWRHWRSITTKSHKRRPAPTSRRYAGTPRLWYHYLSNYTN